MTGKSIANQLSFYLANQIQVQLKTATLGTYICIMVTTF